MVIRAVVLDLDGVIRHFEDGHRAAVEKRHGIRPGSLWEKAWTKDLHVPVTTGAMTMAAWVDEVGRRAGSVEAAREWIAHRGRVDDDVIELTVEVRRRGTPVCVLTNGTDAVIDDLIQHGVADRFDRIFNSWDIGIVKPDAAIYHHVCRELALTPPEVFFTDDRGANVAGAADVGLAAHRFESAATLRMQLADLGVL